MICVPEDVEEVTDREAALEARGLATLTQRKPVLPEMQAPSPSAALAECQLSLEDGCVAVPSDWLLPDTWPPTTYQDADMRVSEA